MAMALKEVNEEGCVGGRKEGRGGWGREQNPRGGNDLAVGENLQECRCTWGNDYLPR